MTKFAAPVLWFILGVALVGYGAAHSIRSYPGAEAFRVVFTHVPEMAAIALFLAGIVAALGGVTLMVNGGRGVTQRYRQIEMAYGGGHRQRYQREDDDWYGDERDYR